MFDFEDARSFVKPKVLPPFWLSMAGVSYCDKTYRVERSCSPITVIEYIISGTGTLNVEGTSYAPSTGDIYILQEKTNHAYAADSHDPWVKIFVNLAGTLPPALLQAFGLTGQVVYPNCQALYPIFEEMIALTKTELPEDALMEQCSMLLTKLLTRLHESSRQDSPPPEEARRLKHFIDSNYHRDLTMDEIAGSIFRSHDYTTKLFKRSYGTTPYAYCIDVKIANAKALLLHTALSIREISERLGYKNDQYFSKQFRKATGITATQFRARSRRSK